MKAFRLLAVEVWPSTRVPVLSLGIRSVPLMTRFTTLESNPLPGSSRLETGALGVPEVTFPEPRRDAAEAAFGTGRLNLAIVDTTSFVDEAFFSMGAVRTESGEATLSVMTCASPLGTVQTRCPELTKSGTIGSRAGSKYVTKMLLIYSLRSTYFISSKL